MSRREVVPLVAEETDGRFSHSPRALMSTCGSSSGLTRDRIVVSSYKSIKATPHKRDERSYLSPTCLQSCQACLASTSSLFQLCNSLLISLVFPRVMSHPPIKSIFPEQLKDNLSYKLCTEESASYLEVVIIFGLISEVQLVQQEYSHV